MREIKFRAWDKRNKTMIDFDIEGIDMYMLQISNQGWQIEFDNSEDDKKWYGKEEFELMQFTGLLDKNGVEIYEGDILTDNIVVIWSDIFASFGLRKSGWLSTHFFQEGVDPKEIEIIGNIYEHQDLIKRHC